MRTNLCGILLLSVLPLTGCEELDLLGIQTPTGDLARVDLVSAPSVTEAAAWACYEWLGDGTCEWVGFGSRPSRSDMTFSFDLVFDVTNPNLSLPVPLVQMLLGVTVMDDTNLGSVCVGFCDPLDPTCQVSSTAADSCALPADTGFVTSDLESTVDNLVDIATDALAGTSNLQYRVIEPLSTAQVHVQFDLGVDPVLDLAGDLLVDAAVDLMAGRQVQIAVPYTVEGALLFDLTEVDRVAVAFGPVAGDFHLEE